MFRKSSISLGRSGFNIRNLTPAGAKAYLLETYERIKTFFRLLPGALLIFRFMRDILRKGVYEIKTSFHYNYKDEIVFDTEFRTLVQLDGDCLNILPPIRLSEHRELNGKDHWIEAYHAAYKVHYQKMEEKLLQIALSWDFWMMVAYAPAFLATNYYLLIDIYDQGITVFQDIIYKPFNWEYLIPYGETTISVASVYFRRRIMAWIMRNIISIIKAGTRFINWLKRIFRRNTGQSKTIKKAMQSADQPAAG